jgi:hypothetical protein
MDINQDYQELSQTNHSIPNKITKTYISFHGEQCIWEKLFLTNAYDTKCMQSKIQGCLYIMLRMPCQMQEMHKGKLYICYKGAPTHPTQEIKQTPSSPTNKWNLLDLGVWWKYRLVDHVCVHGSKLSSLSLHCLLENGISLLCAWFWNEAQGSLLHLWHCCYHIEVEHGYTHQSHSWCMWSKGAESNN